MNFSLNQVENQYKDNGRLVQGKEVGKGVSFFPLECVILRLGVHSGFEWAIRAENTDRPGLLLFVLGHYRCAESQYLRSALHY